MKVWNVVKKGNIQEYKNVIKVFSDVLCGRVSDLMICVIDYCVYDLCFVINFNKYWMVINKILIGCYYFVCCVKVSG